MIWVSVLCVLQQYDESVCDVGVCYVYYNSAMRVFVMWVCVVSVLQRCDERVLLM